MSINSIFGQPKNFNRLNQVISNIDDHQQRQKAFQQFIGAYLINVSPFKVKKIFLPDNIKNDMKKELQQNNVKIMPFIGSFETEEGQLYLYYNHYYLSDEKINRRELISFLGGKDNYKRLIITNTKEQIDINHKRKFNLINYNNLSKLPTKKCKDIFSYLQSNVPRDKQLVPLPHQKEALKQLKRNRNKDRVTILMACGSGKTLIGLWHAEQIKATKILVLVPSLNLMQQTLHIWLKNNKWQGFRYLCVCCDNTVNDGIDELVFKKEELDFPVTTDVKKIKKFIGAKKGDNQATVIFSTYQSSEVLAKGLKNNELDLAIFDEAHKTAGKKDKLFSHALHDKDIKIKQRLFMTATPRHCKIRDYDDEEGELLYSMDNKKIYGPIVYNMSFSEAVKRNIICDYQIIISVITKGDINKALIKKGVLNFDRKQLDFETLGNYIAFSKAFKRYGIKKAITFHSKVATAQKFVSNKYRNFLHILKDFDFCHVNGAIPTADRKRILHSFANNDKSIISNARCLTEGVDVPVVDMVAFLSPKKGKIDIVQAAGRAMRKAPNKRKGYIFIPLFLNEAGKESYQHAIDDLDYSHIWEILHALKENDASLLDNINYVAEQYGETEELNFGVLKNKITVEGIGVKKKQLEQSIAIKCVKKIIPLWLYRYGELKKFKQQYGHCNVPEGYKNNRQLANWVNMQRRDYKKDALIQERINLLEKIGFFFEPLNETWKKRYEELKKFKKKYGHCNVPHKYKDNPRLGGWVVQQRKFCKKNFLTEERLGLLKKLNFSFNALNAAWDKKHEELKKFKKKYSHCNVPRKYKDNPQLSAWVSRQRVAYYKNSLPEGRTTLLKKVGFVFNADNEAWNKRYEELKKFKNEHGHCNVLRGYKANPSLAFWVSRQRVNHKKGVLNDKRAQLLKKISFKWETCGKN
jgi:superfamily II DNA or RNA helicase